MVEVCASGVVEVSFRSEDFFQTLYWSAETVETGAATGLLIWEVCQSVWEPLAIRATPVILTAVNKVMHG